MLISKLLNPVEIMEFSVAEISPLYDYASLIIEKGILCLMSAVRDEAIGFCMEALRKSPTLDSHWGHFA